MKWLRQCDLNSSEFAQFIFMHKYCLIYIIMNEDISKI